MTTNIQTDMRQYYARRAAEYERVYHRPERQEDLRELEGTISRAFQGRDVLEVACGTGYWTQFAARSAASVMGTDLSAEVLELAKQKGYGDCGVRFAVSDAYSLQKAIGPFSAGLAAFWWSHVPKSQLSRFLHVFHARLRHGATVIFLDNVYVEGSSTAISRTDDEGNTYQVRTLSDGSSHEVVKNFPTEEEFAEAIDGLATGLVFRRLTYYWLTRYEVIRSNERQQQHTSRSRGQGT